MVTRLETQLGPAANVNPIGTTYTNLYTSTAATTNILVHMTNTSAQAQLVRLFIADSSWTSGLPAGTTLIAAIVFDASIGVGNSLQVSGIIMVSGQKLIARAAAAEVLTSLRLEW